ncbi:MAG: hypothetical protein EBX40_08630, partial [Gammaproteobacteria bacterium]|nr:hypothetical protein [Gammaproteobacteria bacterium]
MIKKTKVANPISQDGLSLIRKRMMTHIEYGYLSPSYYAFLESLLDLTDDATQTLEFRFTHLCAQIPYLTYPTVRKMCNKLHDLKFIAFQYQKNERYTLTIKPVKQ